MLVALLRQRRRLLLATVAIALSVGYLAGALNLLDRVGNGLDAIAAAGSGRADLVVEGGVAYESPMEQVRRLVPSSIEPLIAGVEGVAATSARIEDTAPIVGPDGTTLVRLGLTEQPVGANYPTDPRLSPYEFVSGGAPASDDEVAIDSRSAEAGDIDVGDDVTVVGRSGARTYRVSGIVRTGSGGLPKGSSLALLSTDEARVRFDRPTDDNTIDVLLEPGADPDRVASSLRGLLPAGIEVVDAATAAVHRQESIDRSFTLVKSLILGFAGLALVVGMVTVGNSLALLYAERRRTFAGLRLVGARPRQLMTAALIEATLLAVVASTIGAPIGLLLGRIIEAALGALNTSVPVAGSAVSWSALGWAVLIGTAATVVAAVLPAWRVCRVAPIEAVVDSGPPRPRTLSQSLITVGVVSVVIGLAAALLVSRGEAGMRPVPLGVGVGTGVAVLGLLPLLLSGLVAGAVRILPMRPHALRSIAARDVSRHRSRTAATAAALILATAVVAGLAVFLASFTTSVDGQVRDLVTADLVIDSGTFTKGGLPEDLVSKVVALPATRASSGWQVGRASIGATPLRVTGFDLAAFSSLLHPTWIGPAPTTLTPSSVLISSRLAESTGLGVGDVVPITFTSGGVETLQVDGVYGAGDLLLGEAVIDSSILERQVPATTDIAALVSLDPDDAATRAEVKALAAASGVDSVLGPESFVQRRSEVVNGFQRVIEWMLLFTLVQALIGVVNTLLLSVGERRREFGLLRASGASRRQVRRMVLGEGVSLAVVGTLVGLVVGVVGARLGVGALASLGLTSFVIPVASVAMVGAAAVLLGVAATVAPARWAAGVPSLEAVLDDGDLRSRPRRAQRPRLHRLGRAGFHWAGFHWAGAGAASGGAGDEASTTGQVPAPPQTLPPQLPPPISTPQLPSPISTPQLPPPISTPQLPSPISTPQLPTPMPPPFRPQPSGSQPATTPPPFPPTGAASPVAPQTAAPSPNPVVSDPGTAGHVAGEPDVRGPADAVPMQVPSGNVRRRARWSGAGTTRRRRSRTDSLEDRIGADPREVAPRDAVAGDAGGGDLGGGVPGRPGRSGDHDGASDPAQDSLRRAAARLDPLSSGDVAGALRIVGSTLAEGEQVERLVAGRVKDIPCVVVRTERRVLVVADRSGRPVVESMHPQRTSVIARAGGDGTVHVTVSDGGREMRLTGVRDATEAESLAGSGVLPR